MQSKPSFSQRYGYEPLPLRMRRDEISRELRVSLWNQIHRYLNNYIKSEPIHLYLMNPITAKKIEQIMQIISDFEKIPIDDIDSRLEAMLEHLKKTVLADKFNRVLDLLEMLCQVGDLHHEIEYEFKRHCAAWRLHCGTDDHMEFVPCSTDEECEAVLGSIDLLHQNNMLASTEQLKRAAEAIRAQRYRDSVANSYMAIEAAARGVSSTKSSTLGAALKALRNEGKADRYILDSIECLGIYANAQEGVRHLSGMKDDTEIGVNEAMAIFGACACFSSYLSNLKD